MFSRYFETMSTRYWQTPERAIGGRFTTRRDGPPIDVIGVARNAKYITFGEGAAPYYFVPLAQEYHGRTRMLIRSREEIGTLMTGLPQEVRALDPAPPIFGVRTGVAVGDLRVYGAAAGSDRFLRPRCPVQVTQL